MYISLSLYLSFSLSFSLYLSICLSFSWSHSLSLSLFITSHVYVAPGILLAPYSNYHTHTYIYIYIYIYVCVCFDHISYMVLPLMVRNILLCGLKFDSALEINVCNAEETYIHFYTFWSSSFRVFWKISKKCFLVTGRC